MLDISVPPRFCNRLALSNYCMDSKRPRVVEAVRVMDSKRPRVVEAVSKALETDLRMEEVIP